MEQNRKHTYSLFISDSGVKAIQGAKIVSSTNHAVTLDVHMQINESKPHPSQKLTQNGS